VFPNTNRMTDLPIMLPSSAECKIIVV